MDIHSGIFEREATTPAKMISGIIAIGTDATAISSLFDNDDIVSPRVVPAIDKAPKTKTICNRSPGIPNHERVKIHRREKVDWARIGKWTQSM